MIRNSVALGLGDFRFPYSGCQSIGLKKELFVVL
jgi:hypothetical protein